MIVSQQLPERFRNVIEETERAFESAVSVTDRNEIPDAELIPIDGKTWLKVPDVSCVFVDMRNSTKMTADHRASLTASVYQFFGDALIRLFHEFGAAYIDIHGDAVFGLFNRNQVHRALAAAVTIKTFCEESFVPKASEKVKVPLGAKIGIDRHVVLVKRIGLRWRFPRTDRQNEVWAGQPVNMAAKLASICPENALLASGRFRLALKAEEALKSCGCPNGLKADLWTQLPQVDDRLGIESAFELKTRWCEKHGAEFCERILRKDG